MMELSRDFVQQGGTYMVLSDRSGIRSSELSKVEAAMIAASRIPRFLPLHVKEVDLQVTLWYDITEKKMLSHMLKSEKINMTEYYALLLQVAESLEESAIYMLQPIKYVLNEDYIFVDGSLQEGTLYLTYIPLDRQEGLKSMQDSLKELVSRFMASVTELSGSGVQQLLQYTASEDFTPGGFKKLLLGLLSSEGDIPMSAGMGKHAPVSRQRDQIGEPHRREAAIRPGRLGGEEIPEINGRAAPWQQAEAVSRLQDKPGGSMRDLGLRREAANGTAERNEAWTEAAMSGEESVRSKLHPVGRDDDALPGFLKSWGSSDTDKGLDVDENDDETAQKSASARKTYIALGCLLVAAIVWRMIYMTDPGSGTLILCTALTVILGAVAVMTWMGKLFAPKLAEADSASFDALPDFGSVELAAEPKHRQGRSRFEVDMFTGFLRGGRKSKEDVFGKTEKDDEPEWKWKFPPEDAVRESRDDNRDESLRGGSADNGRPVDALRRDGWGVANERSSRYYTGIDERDDYSGLGPRTENLQPGKGGATVLLSPSAVSVKDNQASALSLYSGYLLRESEGESGAERIELRQQHFVIGRSEDVAQYVERSVGTSRAHVELSRSEDGRFMIKDLGSKNGTRLKGEAMVPYKEYPLQDGDTFVIVKGHYTFRSA